MGLRAEPKTNPLLGKCLRGWGGRSQLTKMLYAASQQGLALVGPRVMPSVSYKNGNKVSR